MCIKEYLGYYCGHCSVGTLKLCPQTQANLGVFQPCAFPAERPNYAAYYCEPCWRIVWNTRILQKEELHKAAHTEKYNKGIYCCDNIFSDEERANPLRPGQGQDREQGQGSGQQNDGKGKGTATYMNGDVDQGVTYNGGAVVAVTGSGANDGYYSQAPYTGYGFGGAGDLTRVLPQNFQAQDVQSQGVVGTSANAEYTQDGHYNPAGPSTYYAQSSGPTNSSLYATAGPSGHYAHGSGQKGKSQYKGAVRTGQQNGTTYAAAAAGPSGHYQQSGDRGQQQATVNAGTGNLSHDPRQAWNFAAQGNAYNYFGYTNPSMIQAPGGIEQSTADFLAAQNLAGYKFPFEAGMRWYPIETQLELPTETAAGLPALPILPPGSIAKVNINARTNYTYSYTQVNNPHRRSHSVPVIKTATDSDADSVHSDSTVTAPFPLLEDGMDHSPMVVGSQMGYGTPGTGSATGSDDTLHGTPLNTSTATSEKGDGSVENVSDDIASKQMLS